MLYAYILAAMQWLHTMSALHYHLACGSTPDSEMFHLHHTLAHEIAHTCAALDWVTDLQYYTTIYIDLF